MKKFFVLVLCIVCIAACAFWLTTVNHGKPSEDASTTSSQEQTQPADESAELGSPYKFYYEKLTDTEKRAYDRILSEIYSMPESITLPRIDADQLDSVFSALLSDNPDLFFVGRKCTLITEFFRVSCSIEYIFDKEEYEERKAELDKVCDEVISSLSDPDDDWQTELEIHDYIVDNCEYKLLENEHVYSSAYGALVNGEAACEGYSKAAKLLFDKAGMESAVVSGVSKAQDGNGGAHMWNAVKVYGDFYYLDCTWDDPLNEEGESVKTYSYFNLSDEMIASTHSDFSYDFGCDATAANYYIKNNRYFKNYDREDEDAVARILADALDAGEESVEIRFASKEVFDRAVDDLIDGERIYDVLTLARAKTSVGFSRNSVSYFADSDLLTLTIAPKLN